ncbi:ADP-ribosylation factor protein 3 [Tritrichomonas musculus]|uniref:ADP-ribosylation factor protein 3 n=1 Tax=Tritrichomonas musculus TaxID=1915356 RepID=A0ABR2GKS9_9EUKA
MFISHSQQKKKLLFLGLDNAGKTSILHALIGASPYTVSPTRGLNTRQVEFDRFKFNIFDVGGQKSLRSHWGDYFNDVYGVVWVIDSADKRRMYETGLELAILLQDEKLMNVPILIMANKQDLSTALSAAEVFFDFFSSNTRLQQN